MELKYLQSNIKSKNQMAERKILMQKCVHIYR